MTVVHDAIRRGIHKAAYAMVLTIAFPMPLWAGSTLTQTADAGADTSLSLAALSHDATPPPQPPGGVSTYRALAKSEAEQKGLPWEIADAVMSVESGYNPGAIGTSGEIGLMQILPSTARLQGFAGSDLDLAVPQTNIHYGGSSLAEA